MTNSAATSEEAEFQSFHKGIIPRPEFQLRSLPIDMRWEVSRRHPYYQVFWKDASRYYHQEFPSDSEEHYFRQVYIAILGAIGVSASPPNPCTEFQELGEEYLEQGWLSGAIQPITFKCMAGMMITSLPKDALQQLAGFFMTAAREDNHNEENFSRYKALEALASSNLESLGQFPDAPFVSVDPFASTRQVTKSITDLRHEWQDRLRIEDHRNRSDKFPEYLRVWDLREGWNNGQYDRSQERLLKDIASDLRMSITTVHNRYCSAFELITGHPYSLEIWLRLFGPLKLSSFFGSEVGLASRHRPLNSQVRRDVPDSVVSPSQQENDGEGIIGSCPDTSFSIEYTDLVIDINSMIDSGKTNQQIIAGLEISSKGIDLIEYFRQRKTEME